MRLASSLPLRATLGAAAALAMALVVLMLLIGAAANRTLSARTLDALDAEMAEARAVFSTDGLDALAGHLDRRGAAGGATRYSLVLDTGPTRGSLPPATITTPHDRNVFSYIDAATGQSHLAAGRRAIIPLAEGRTATLLIAHDIDDQRHLARIIQLLALAGTGAVALSALAFGLFARRRLLSRLDTVTNTSRAIMAGDLSQRIPSDASGDEIDQMAQTLNAMLTRIEDLMQALRDVSDNIAHDLRTPLNRLRLIAEEALHAKHTPAPTQESLGRVIEEADRLIITFNDMLLITRLEHGVGADTFEDVDVARLVDDTAELYLPFAEDSQLVVHVEPPPPQGTIIKANRQLLGQAIANLIDNAIKYTPPSRQRTPSDVVIAVRKTPASLEIVVSDSGPGIAPEDRERALKRFVRLEKSRSLPGTGLGLSLVAAVARMHHGSIRLEDNAPGLRAVLALPLPSRDEPGSA